MNKSEPTNLLASLSASLLGFANFSKLFSGTIATGVGDGTLELLYYIMYTYFEAIYTKYIITETTSSKHIQNVLVKKNQTWYLSGLKFT